MYKRILTLIMAVLMTVSLFSCSNSSDGENNGTEEAVVGIPVASLSELSIILPKDGIEKTLLDACAYMKYTIESKYNVKLQQNDDASDEISADTYEILVGKTNRSESEAVYDRLEKYNDIEICLVGKKLVIAGENQELLANEVRNFISAIKAVPDGALEAIDATMQVSVKGDYKVGKILLCGVNLSEYTIVYQSNNTCRIIANELSNSIRDITGYVLEISADDDIPNGKSIFLGNTQAGVPSGANKDKTDEYYIASQDGDVYLFATEANAVHEASLYLTALFSSASGEEAAIIPEIGAVVAKDTTITSMSFNLWVTDIASRKDNVINTIKKHSPDTFGVQEANEEWMDILKRELGDTYAYVGVGRDSGDTGEASAVFYKKDEFTLLDGGTKWLTDTPNKPSKINGSNCNRIFSYALLKRKDDGVEFMHINTHLDHGADNHEVRKKQAEYLISFAKKHADKAIIISGDFNSQAGTPAYEYVMSVMDNSSEIAMNSDKKDTFWSGVTYDYIFMSKNDFTVFDYTVDDSITDKKLSDHYPIIIKFKVK